MRARASFCWKQAEGIQFSSHRVRSVHVFMDTVGRVCTFTNLKFEFHVTSKLRGAVLRLRSVTPSTTYIGVRHPKATFYIYIRREPRARLSKRQRSVYMFVELALRVGWRCQKEVEWSDSITNAGEKRNCEIWQAILNLDIENLSRYVIDNVLQSLFRFLIIMDFGN